MCVVFVYVCVSHIQGNNGTVSESESVRGNVTVSESESVRGNVTVSESESVRVNVTVSESESVRVPQSVLAVKFNGGLKPVSGGTK